MKVLYDINTQQIISPYYESQPEDVFFEEGHIELEVVKRNIEDEPVLGVDYDPSNQFVRGKATINLNLDANPQVKQYIEGWEIVDLTPEQIERRYIQSLDWNGLEDDLETVELVDTPSDTFFYRAITTTNQNAYALLLNCFGANRWDKRLGPALQLVKDSLPTPLTDNELIQLNTILANNNFNIVII